MVELVILACLMKEPSHCEAFDVSFFAPTHVMECLVRGQMFMARWAEEHPDWVVRRWRCDLPKA